MKKLVWIFSIIALLSFLLDGIGSHSKFGIKIAKYKNIISKRNKYFEINENINKYSWNTPITLPDSNLSLTIEHLAIANNTDIKMIKEITNHKFFMTMIAFENNSSNNIVSIDIQNIVNDEHLPFVSSYLYRYAIAKNYRWEVQKIESLESISKYKKIAAIGYIYPFPKEVSTNLFGTSKNLFTGASQSITIVYWDKNNIKKRIEYKFQLDYYLFMSVWDKIITIT